MKVGYFVLTKILAIFCGCTAWFVSDLVGNPEDRFSRDEAQIPSSYGLLEKPFCCIHVLK